MKIQDKELLQIGELAKHLGITTRTIRYYEEISLLNAPRRLSGGVRVYGKDDVTRLKFILRLKELGITLKEMQELAEIYDIKSEDDQFLTIVPRLLEMLDTHIAKIDEKIARVTSLRQEITRFRGKIVEAAKEMRVSNG